MTFWGDGTSSEGVTIWERRHTKQTEAGYYCGDHDEIRIARQWARSDQAIQVCDILQSHKFEY